MKYKKVRCDICKIDIHRAPYSRHLKNKKHLKSISQNKVSVPRKKLKQKSCRRKEVVKVSDTKF